MRARLLALAMLLALSSGGCVTEDEALWGGHISFFRGFFESAGGEFFAGRSRGETEEELCVVEWSSRFVSTPTDCEACEYAVELEYGEPEVLVDVACEAYDLDLGSIAGTRLTVGYAGHRLYVREGGAWSVGGLVERDEEDEPAPDEEDEDEISFLLGVDPDEE